MGPLEQVILVVLGMCSLCKLALASSLPCSSGAVPSASASCVKGLKISPRHSLQRKPHRSRHVPHLSPSSHWTSCSSALTGLPLQPRSPGVRDSVTAGLLASTSTNCVGPQAASSGPDFASHLLAAQSLSAQLCFPFLDYGVKWQPHPQMPSWIPPVIHSIHIGAA